MTPKEKAEQLYLKFSYAIRDEETSEGYFSNALHSKNCALIAVDELLNSHWDDRECGIGSKVQFYRMVKSEINKL